MYKLYSNIICPFVHRVEIVLAEKKLDPSAFERVDVPLGGDMPDWYLKINPAGTIPCLQTPTGDTVYESLLIAKYLDAVLPGALLMGRTPEETYRIEFFLSQVGDLVGAGYTLLRDPQNEEKFQAYHANAAYIDGIVAENQTTGGPFFFDDYFSLADAALLPFLMRFQILLPFHTGINLWEKAPALKRMWAVGHKRPSVAERFLPAKEILHSYIRYPPAGLPATVAAANGVPLLYYNPYSSFSDAIRVAFALAKVEHELAEVDLANQPLWYKHINPRGTVPALRTEDGEIHHESWPILLHVAATHPDSGLLPTDPKARYELDYYHEKAADVTNYALHRVLRNPEFNDENAKDLREGLAEVEALLPEAGPFHGGARPDAADLHVLPSLVRLQACTPALTQGINFLSEYPKVNALCEAGKALPAAQSVLLSDEKYLERFQSPPAQQQ